MILLPLLRQLLLLPIFLPKNPKASWRIRWVTSRSMPRKQIAAETGHRKTNVRNFVGIRLSQSDDDGTQKKVSSYTTFILYCHPSPIATQTIILPGVSSIVPFLTRFPLYTRAAVCPRHDGPAVRASNDVCCRSCRPAR